MLDLTCFQVEFKIDQVGAWHSSFKMFSISQTLDRWYNLVYCTLAYAALYASLATMAMIKRWSHLTGRDKLVLGLEICVPILQFSVLLWYYIADKSPPYVFEDLIKASLTSD